MFRRAIDDLDQITRDIAQASKNALCFGVDYLDDALRGIMPDDLILIGAPSGLGKTALCCIIALANLLNGKRVHYIALEASKREIEKRLIYPLIAERYYSDPSRPRLPKKLSYSNWILGDFTGLIKKYEDDALEFFEAGYKNLNIYYREEKFGIPELIQSVLWCSAETDLIIIDHVHYFDLDDDNENRAIKEIAKTVRALALDEQKPIVLVAHLRKRDKFHGDLVAGLEEFHGSSDLYKIATKVITMAPGAMTPDGSFETFFRIPKNRNDGGTTRFLAREFFSPKKGGYEKDKYQLGWADTSKSDGFEMLGLPLYPEWARNPTMGPGDIARLTGDGYQSASTKYNYVKD